MPNSAAEIGSNDSYTGNAGLGNVGLGVFNIDTRPLEQLAHYTFFYKKNLWEQKQKETDAKVAELADLSNISLNDLRGHDKEQATKEFSDLLSYASEYARKDPKTAQEKIENELEWQTKYGAFKNNFGSGKARATSYYAHLNTIKQNITDATTQDEAIRQLNKSFDDTDISTPISAVPNFKIEKFDIPDPTPQKFNSVAILGNDNLDIEGSIYNPKLNAGIADATILGIGKVYPKKGTKEYDALSENEKNQVAIQSTITSSGKGWVDATEPLNRALKNYIKDKDGKFDAESFETDNASNTTLMNAYNALKKYDADNRDRYNQALNGYFTDKGLSIPLPANVNPNDFKVGFVDFAKGVNANQLVQSGMYAKYAGDVFAKKVTHTGESNDLIKARLIQAGETNRTLITQRHEDARARLPYDEIKLSTGKNAKPVVSTDFNPLASIVASVGGLNKQVKLSSLSIAQIGAINQQYLDKDNTLKDEFKDYVISIGNNKPNGAGDYGVYIYDDKGKSVNDFIVNESALKSNGSSWLATFGKETKGQDAYQYDPTKFTEAWKNNVIAPISKQVPLTDAQKFLQGIK